MKRFPQPEAGQSLTEYALIIALVAIVLVTALTTFQVAVANGITGIVSSL